MKAQALLDACSAMREVAESIELELTGQPPHEGDDEVAVSEVLHGALVELTRTLAVELGIVTGRHVTPGQA